MKFVKWLDERTGFCTAFMKIANMQSPAGKFCCRFMPVALVFLFLLQGLTGIFLWAFYSSSATSAWESVFYIQYVLPFGWLVRGIHHYSAQLFVGVSGFYVLCLVLHGAYRRPREFVYWSALTIFLLSLCSCLTGDLLPWSQSGYFATTTRVSFLQLLPVIGVPLYQIVAGGPDPQFGSLTITRFLFLHVCVFGGGGFVALCLWKFFDIRSRKLLREEKRFDGVHKCCLACASKERSPFWGKDALFVGITCVVVFAAVLLLVFQRSLTAEQIANRVPTLPAESYLGAELTGPVDVSSSYDAARPEWSFRALYHMTKLPIFSKIGMFYAIFVVPPFFLLCFFIAPILGRNKALHILVVAASTVFFVVICYFTYLSYWSDYSPKSEHSAGFKAGVADAKRTADRSIELAFAPTGIPKTGALTLTKSDPFLTGPALFTQHCASCHNFKAKSDAAVNPDYVEIECSDPTAPNLYGAHTADWIRGFTNEATLADVDCFGKTAFAEKGSMIGFMKGRVAGGMTVNGGAFILNSNGLIAKVIAADGSPAYDILESVFEDFCDDEDNITVLRTILNEDNEFEDDAVTEAQTQYISKLKELIESKLADEEFVSELDPKLPASVQATLKQVLLDMLEDEVYLELLLDEDNIELVIDGDFDDFLTDSYLATLNGNDEPIPPEDLKYINALRDSIVVACDTIAEVLAEEAKLDEPRPFVEGQYYGLAPTALSDMEFLTCTECHAFYGTENDHACDLRGYMSRDWIAGFIADPTAPKFYGDKNDRMPAYCPTDGDALMTPEEVGMLADWLSGKWYRAPEIDNSKRIGKPGVAKAAAIQKGLDDAANAAQLKAEADELKAQALREEEERELAKAEELKAKEEKAKAAAEAKAKKEAEEKTKLEAELKELKAALEEANASAKDAAEKADAAASEASETISNVEKERDAAQNETKTLQKQLDDAKSQAKEALEEALSGKNDAEQRAADVQASLQKQLRDQEAEAKNQLDSLKTQYLQAMNVQKEALTQRLSESQNRLQKEVQARQDAEQKASQLNAALTEARKEVDALREQLEKAAPSSEE